MRYAILIAPLLCGCFATTGELETAVTEITGRIDAVANDAQESAEAAREAWRQGEITYAELQQRLQDIRAATLDVAKETTREVMGELKETLENRPEVIAGAAADVSRNVIPGPWGELLGMAIVAAGTYAASSAKAKQEAEKAKRAASDEVWDLEHERVKRQAEGKGK